MRTFLDEMFSEVFKSGSALVCPSHSHSGSIKPAQLSSRNTEFTTKLVNVKDVLMSGCPLVEDVWDEPLTTIHFQFDTVEI